MSVIKKYLPHFLKETKAANNGKLPANIELLYQYFEYLGKFHKSFKDLTPDHLSTGWKGVYQIYDIIRKNAHLSDEKQIEDTPGGKLTPPKTPIGKLTPLSPAKRGKKSPSIA